MFVSMLAWLPKSAEMEAAGLACSDRLLRSAQDLQCALLGAARESLIRQQRLLDSWATEKQWPQALADAAQMNEESLSGALELLQHVVQIGAHAVNESVAHAHEQRRLLLEQARLLRERIAMAAPDTPAIVAMAMGSWLDLFGRKSEETADISKRMAALAEAMMAIATASRRDIAA